MRRLPRLEVSNADRTTLEARAASTDLPARVVQRANIVLLAAEGMANCDIAAKVNMHWNRVAVWRRRFAQEGLAGLEDEQRSGRPPVYGLDEILLLLRILTTEPPAALPRWTVESIATQMTAHGVPISSSQTWRICTMLDLKPWDVDGWHAARPARRWEKVSDLRGIYLAGGVGACVFSFTDDQIGRVDGERHDPGVSGRQAPGARGSESPGTSAAPGARQFLAQIDQERHPALGPSRAEDAPAGALAAFVSDLAGAAPERSLLHCVALGPSSPVDLLDDGPSERVALLLTSDRSAWLHRLELLFDVLERDVLAGEVDAADLRVKERTVAFVKERLAAGRPAAWTALAHDSGLAAAV